MVSAPVAAVAVWAAGPHDADCAIEIARGRESKSWVAGLGQTFNTTMYKLHLQSTLVFYMCNSHLYVTLIISLCKTSCN